VLGQAPLGTQSHGHPVITQTDGRGRLLTINQTSLSRSDRDACTFAPLLDPDPKREVLSVMSWPSEPDRLWVLAASYAGGSPVSPQATPVLASDDAGRTFRPLSTLPAPWLGVTMTMPSWTTPVLFMRGIQRGGADQTFFRSVDAGASWQEIKPVPQGPGKNDFWPFLLGTARQPGVVYFLVPGHDAPSDEVWVSRDAGQTATRALTIPSPGVVTAAFADPESDDLFVASQENGATRSALHVSRDNGRTFAAPVYSPTLISCIKRWQGKLLACQRNQFRPEANFDVGISEDEGRTWRPFYKMIDTAPPTGCLGEVCRKDYEYLKAQVTPSVFPEDGPDGGAAPDAGAKAGASQGCAIGSGAGGGAPTLLVLGVLLTLGRRRRQGAR
jgi:hypothetical protein